MAPFAKNLDNLSPQEVDALLAQLLRQKASGSQSPPSSYPLSHGQQALWFLYQSAPKSAAYNVGFSVRIRSHVDRRALRQAFQMLLERHAILRTTFKMSPEGGPVQVVDGPESAKGQEVFFQEVDASEWTGEALREQVDLAYKQPFDLEEGPLLRVSLFTRSQHTHVLLLTIHHIAVDAWSVGILLDDLRQLYPVAKAMSQGTREGHKPPLPSPVPYADFVTWQRDKLQAEGEHLLAYWQEQLAEAPQVLNLPTDYVRSPVQTYKGASLSFQLSPRLTAKIRQLARSEGATLYMTLLAAFQLLLQRYTSSDSLLVGSPVAGRHQKKFGQAVGNFVNSIVLRADFAGNPPARAFLRQVRSTVLNALAHQEYPFSLLVKELQVKRTASHSPLFQANFVLQKSVSSALQQLSAPNSTQHIDWGGLELSSFPLAQREGQFDLTLEMVEGTLTEEGRESLVGLFKYNPNLFSPTTIKRMVGHFQSLLEAVVSNPSHPIRELPLLLDSERHQLLVEWNNTATDYPTDKCIHTVFEEQVERTPEATAVIFGDDSLSYRDINRRANQLAHYLIRQEVGPEIVVGLCVERSLEMVVGLLGILKAGAAYLPLDPSLPNERSSFMIKDAFVSIILTQQHLVETLPQVAQTICLDADWASKMGGQSSQNPQSTNLVRVKPENLAYIIFTSGSTGRPKGVAIEHRQLLNYVVGIQEALDLPTGASFATVSTLAADLGNTAIFPTLCTGGTLMVISQEQLSDPAKFADYALKYPMDCLKITPSHLGALMSGERPAAVLPRQLLVLGGEASRWDFLSQIHSLAPSCRIVNHYGPTETTIGVLTYPTSPGINHSGLVTVPIGRPIANTQAYILDRYRQPVPIGVPGELHIGGAGLARGYLNRPQLTSEKFIPNPFGPGRLYKTGDLCRYLPESSEAGSGNIEFLGRTDYQVKIRGFRIELGEIETALNNQPNVRSAVVVVREEAGSKRLVAYVVCERPVLSSVLRSWLSDKLPDYMVPTAFVQLDALPLTPNGKVNRRALPVPDESSLTRSSSFVAPRHESEKTLAAIWQELLRVQQVGVHDNFFELGGDSILSIQIISRAKQAGLHLTPQQLFKHQTIAKLASVASTSSIMRAEQGVVTGALPLTPIQVWFFEQQGVAPHHYNQSVLLSLSPLISPSVLSQAITDLLIHHDALRLRFRHDGQRWQQTIVAPSFEIPFEVVDLSALSREEAASALESRANQYQASLNLSQGPLLRVVLFQLKASSRLLIVIHHLAVDGVSWRILLEDLQTAIQQRRRGEKIKLPAKTTSFKAWAAQLNQKGPAVVANELAYWQISPSSGLPVDHQLGENNVASATTLTCTLSKSQTQVLLSEVPAVYQTQINDLLLTALLLAFQTWSGENTLLIDLEGHGREELFEGYDLSRTVGWFTTIFPVRLKLESIQLGEAIKSIKEQLRQIPNRGIGYTILHYLSDEDSPGAKSQVRFNYLGQIDQMTQGTSFEISKEASGYTQSLKQTRPYLLDILGMVSSGQLQVTWTYSQNSHQRQTILDLANRFIEALEALIAHCQEPEAGGYTPSDFSKVSLSQNELDDLLSEFG